MDTAQSPAALFVLLWREIRQLAPDERVLLTPPADTWKQKIDAALLLDAAESSAAGLTSILSGNQSSDRDLLRLKLEVMRKIDFAFYSIHPRSKCSPMGTPTPRPTWLTQAVAERELSGAYFTDSNNDRLVARGPLLRIERAEDASSADSVADRFAALSVVSGELELDGRRILVSHRVIGSSKFDGVSLGKSVGEERIAFLAVAQDPEDLHVEYKNFEGVDFVDFRTNPSLDVPGRVLKGLRQVGEVDISIAPELVISEEQVTKICEQISGAALGVRLFVAGSGHTVICKKGALCWNETRVVNSIGKELWRQRKLWPAAIPGAQAIRLGAAGGGDKQHFEYNAAGDTIEVVDVNGLGRCIIFICQDLVGKPLADELLREYQPDWAFVPIMADDLSHGRWAHRQAFAQSSSCRTRFVLSTNTAYARKSGNSSPVVMGMAVGPLVADAEDKGRLCAELSATSSAGIEYALIRWRSEELDWKFTKFVLEG